MTPAFLSVASPAILTACAAFLAIGASLLHQNKAYFVLKPLTTLLIIAYAFAGLESLADKRGLLIVAGLSVSLLGDVFLLFPKRFLLGLVSFSFAHLCYATSFFSGVSTLGLLYFALPLVVCGGLVIAFLWRDLTVPKVAVVFYMLLLALMVYQAGERYLLVPDLLKGDSGTQASLLALIGAVLFFLSDTLLAINKFKKPLQNAALWVLATYYSAQWLIAFSVHIRFR